MLPLELYNGAWALKS